MIEVIALSLGLVCSQQTVVLWPSDSDWYSPDICGEEVRFARMTYDQFKFEIHGDEAVILPDSFSDGFEEIK